MTPRVGDIVHVKGDGSRGTWKLAKIVNLNVGADGKIRLAKISCNGSILSRAIAHLYPLECEDRSDDHQVNDDQEEIEF